MGPLEQVADRPAGDREISRGWAGPNLTKSKCVRVEAIISSMMTPDERRKQHILNGGRRKRIAKGSGTSVEEVNRLLKQFVQMQKMLKSLGGMAGLTGGGQAARRRAMHMLRRG